MMDCLSFTISRRTCAVPRESIEAVSFMLAFSERAELPSIVLGEARWRGFPLPGLDLARLLGEMDHCYQAGARVLICTGTDGYCALLADSVDGIITLEPDTALIPLARLFQTRLSEMQVLDVNSVFSMLNDWEGPRP